MGRFPIHSNGDEEIKKNQQNGTVELKVPAMELHTLLHLLWALLQSTSSTYTLYMSRNLSDSGGVFVSRFQFRAWFETL